MNRVLATMEEKRRDRNRGIPVVIPENGFERRNWLTEIVRIPMIWVLDVLPTRIGRGLFLMFSGPKGDTRTVFRWAATYRALECMYTFWERKAEGKTSPSDDFWETFLDNARAIRNRLKLFKQELRKTIQEVAEKKGEVNLLSLGSGSARGVLEVVNDLNGRYSIRVRLIDASRRAINFSKEMAENCGIEDIEWHRDWAQSLEKYCKDFQPDVIEMVGLLDYFTHEMALELIRKIHKTLSPGGYFIVSNVAPNLEVPFATKAIDWLAIYRSPKELAEVLLESGFREKNIRVFVEPLKIHVLVVAKKVV